MKVKNFEDLEIWKDARALTRGIFPADERFEIFEGFRFAGSKLGAQQCR
jgi:hypothetical protein